MKYLMKNLSGLTFEVDEEMKKHGLKNGIPEGNFTEINDNILELEKELSEIIPDGSEDNLEVKIKNTKKLKDIIK